MVKRECVAVVQAADEWQACTAQLRGSACPALSPSNSITHAFNRREQCGTATTKVVPSPPFRTNEYANQPQINTGSDGEQADRATKAANQGASPGVFRHCQGELRNHARTHGHTHIHTHMHMHAHTHFARQQQSTAFTLWHHFPLVFVLFSRAPAGWRPSAHCRPHRQPRVRRSPCCAQGQRPPWLAVSFLLMEQPPCSPPLFLLVYHH